MDRTLYLKNGSSIDVGSSRSQLKATTPIAARPRPREGQFFYDLWAQDQEER